MNYIAWLTLAQASKPRGLWAELVTANLILTMITLAIVMLFLSKAFSRQIRQYAIRISPGAVLVVFSYCVITGLLQGRLGDFIAMSTLAVFGFVLAVQCMIQPAGHCRNSGVGYSYFFGGAIVVGVSMVLAITFFTHDFVETFLIAGTIMMLGWTIVAVKLFRHSMAREKQLVYCCTACFYDLRGSPDAVNCPECGQKITQAADILKNTLATADD